MFSGWGSGLTKNRRNNDGFTLVELMVVLAIVSMLAVLSLPFTAGALDKAKAARSESDLREIQLALEWYYSDHGHFPNKMALLTGTYLRSSFAFESPYSTKKKPIYYLYAVDDNNDGKAQAYILGDPGPSPATDKHVGAKGALPNGLKPGAKTYAYAWACHRSASTALAVDTAMDCSTTETSLRSYRADDLPRLRTEG